MNLQPFAVSVNDMTTTELQRLTNRSIGFYRAAQILADACMCRAGLQPESLKTMDRAEAIWFKQTAQQLIHIFEEITVGKQPVPEQEPRLGPHPREEAINQERQRAQLAAAERGHELSTWGPVVMGPIYDESASCVRCGRHVTIVVQDGPPLSLTHEGPALDEGCIVDAGEVR